MAVTPSEKLTLINNNIRSLTGSSDLLGLDEMKSNLDTIINDTNEQNDLINQINQLLDSRVNEIAVATSNGTVTQLSTVTGNVSLWWVDQNLVAQMCYLNETLQEITALKGSVMTLIGDVTTSPVSYTGLAEGYRNASACIVFRVEEDTFSITVG